MAYLLKRKEKMLDYTRGVIDDTIASIRRLTLVTDIIAQIVYISYLIISIITGNGFLIASCILLAISVIYFVYFLATLKKWYTKEEKTRRKRIINLFWYTKKLVHLVVIALAIVNIYLSETIDAFSILAVVFMILGFLIPSLLKAITTIIERRTDLFAAAIKRDLLKPVSGITTVVKKITHNDSHDEEEEALHKRLDEICSEQKDARKKKRAWEKSLRKSSKSKN